MNKGLDPEQTVHLRRHDGLLECGIDADPGIPAKQKPLNQIDVPKTQLSPIEPHSDSHLLEPFRRDLDAEPSRFRNLRW